MSRRSRQARSGIFGILPGFASEQIPSFVIIHNNSQLKENPHTGAKKDGRPAADIQKGIKKKQALTDLIFTRSQGLLLFVLGI